VAGAPMTDYLDDLLGILHRDRTSVLEEQLRAIETEIAHRRLLGAENTVRLWEEITNLNNQILNAMPNKGEIDFRERTRHQLEQERRAAHKDLNDELTKTWQAIQELKREQRQLFAELWRDRQRYERFLRDYDA